MAEENYAKSKEDQEKLRMDEMLNFSSELEYEDADIMKEDEYKKPIAPPPKSGLPIEEVFPDPYQKPPEQLTPFDLFLKEHTVTLPFTQTNQYKLLKNMLDDQYHLYEHKKLGSLENIVIMNEVRRKTLQLPPLKPIDYDCIDKSSKKLKIILDCLEIIRRPNGISL
jgi:hypothetical protein